MLFGASMGEHAVGVFVALWLIVYVAIKLFKTVDDGGEVRKAANEGLAGWIRGLFK
jgi:hypothetical protein